MILRPDPKYPHYIASVAHELEEAGINHTCTEIVCRPKNEKERDLVRKIGRHCIVEEDA